MNDCILSFGAFSYVSSLFRDPDVICTLTLIRLMSHRIGILFMVAAFRLRKGG